MNALSPSLLPQPLALVARLIHWLALIIRNLRILALPPSSFAVRRDEAVHTWLNDTKFASRATCMYEFTVARGGDARSQRSTELELRPMMSLPKAEHVRHALGDMSEEIILELPVLRKVFVGPGPDWSSLMSHFGLALLLLFA